MNLLLDTNILIPLEPASPSDVEASSAPAIRLVNLANEVGASLFVHPMQSDDIATDKNEPRRTLRQLLIQKYRQLPNPPPLNDRAREAANLPVEGTNSWIDAHLVAALDQNAIAYLVSSDR